ncbi:hypothetical protein Sru01_66370 [Sphaerisporangium rufum]|uniref:Pyrrolo-quinoline quinone repeat domain-containing protein n=1 Tax=Sphaerisporangium rufum TaxID=1381558 RepID=A0A919RBF5_9ACTN|nr:PQQ-binding-like beta-propeller repeat protein [Sphaerisporangium rufum]GII81655.1 hypothetical protein Sru01_66370 [Sphaerisporangium rufum]
MAGAPGGAAAAGAANVEAAPGAGGSATSGPGRPGAGSGAAGRAGRRALLYVGGGTALVLVVLAAVLLSALWPFGGSAGGPGGRPSGSGTPGAGSAAPGGATELTGQVGWEVAAAPRRAASGAVLGSWAVPGALLRADHAALVSWDAATGAGRGRLRPPGGGAFCAAAQEVAADVLALAYGPRPRKPGAAGRCAGVLLVEPATGSVRHRVSLAGTAVGRGAAGRYGTSLAVAGDTLVVARGRAVTGFGTTDGSVRWEAGGLPAGCAFRDVLAGPAGAVLLASCGRSRPAVVLALDPATGARRWRVVAPSGATGESGSLVAADPVVAALPKAGGAGRYLVLGRPGEVTASIPQSGPYGTLDMRPIGRPGGRARYRVVLAGGALVTATTPSQVSELRDTNDLVAFGLADGGRRWSRRLDPASTAVPAAADGDTVIVMRTGTYERPPQAYRLRSADGSGGPMGPAYPRELVYTPADGLFRYSGRTLFLVTDLDDRVGAVLLR